MLWPRRFTPAGCVRRPMRLPFTASKPRASSTSMPSMTGYTGADETMTGVTRGASEIVVVREPLVAEDAVRGALATEVAGAEAGRVGALLELQPNKPSSRMRGTPRCFKGRGRKWPRMWFETLGGGAAPSRNFAGICSQGIAVAQAPRLHPKGGAHCPLCAWDVSSGGRMDGAEPPCRRGRLRYLAVQRSQRAGHGGG